MNGPGAQTTDWQVSYWDRVGSAKVFGHPVNFERLRRLVPPEGQILDVGCGYGRVASLLHRGGYRNVVGVDQSSVMIAKAQDSCPSLNFLHIEPGPLPFDDSRFDAVLLSAF